MSDLMGGGVYTDMWMCINGKEAFELVWLPKIFYVTSSHWN
jgi:hypothetical protein